MRRQPLSGERCGGHTIQPRLDLPCSPDPEVAATTARRLSKRKHLPVLYRHGRSAFDSHVIKTSTEIGTREGDLPLAFKADGWPPEGKLHDRRIRRVTHQVIGGPRRATVQHTAERHAQRPMMRSAQIVDLGLETSSLDVQDQSCHCANDAYEIRWNVTRSPTRKRNGSDDATSKGLNGVRPSTCQPPGDATG